MKRLPVGLIGRSVAVLVTAGAIGLVHNAFNPAGIVLWASAREHVATGDPARVHAGVIDGAAAPRLKAIRAVDGDVEGAAALDALQAGRTRVGPDGFRCTTVLARILPVHGISGDQAQIPIPVVQWEDIRETVNGGGVILLDARSGGAFEAGHIPTAESLPFGDLDARINQVLARYAPDQPLVAYCGNDHCGLGRQLAEQLAGRYGYQNVRCMPGGYLEWRRAVP